MASYAVRIVPLPKGAFSTDNSYVSLDIVSYNGLLYMFTASKAAGAWDSTKVMQISGSSDILDGGDSSQF